MRSWGLARPLVVGSLAVGLLACGGGDSANGTGGGTASGTASGTGGMDGTGGQGAGTGGSGATGGTGGMVTPGYTIDEAVSWHSSALKTSVHFAPLDQTEEHVLAQLGSAQTSIRLAFFNLRLEGVRDLLIAKHTAGVDVEVVLDLDVQALSYNTMGDELSAAGVPVVLADNDSAAEATMHNKVAIIDDHLVMTGSANYSFTGLNVSDEDLLTFDDSDLAARYDAEIDEIVAASGDVESTPYTGDPPLQAWMGPEDDLYDKAVALLDGAQNTALVAMFQVNATPLVDAMLDAKTRGVNVIAVVDEKQATQTGEDADETLIAAGIPVVLALNTGNMVAEMHSKFVVVDHQTVMMGSFNWTNLGSFFNDENAVIIDDAHLAARFEGKLANLIDTYASVTPASLGLVTGDQAVSFAVPNVTLQNGAELWLETDAQGPYPQGIKLDGGSVSTMIAAGTRLDYHYEIRTSQGLLLEEQAEHSFTVPYAAGPFAVEDAFQSP